MIFRNFLISVLIIVPIAAEAQQRMEDVITRRNRPLFFYELNTVPSDSSGSDYFFHFSVSHDYLAFINTAAAGEKTGFRSAIRLGVQVWFADSSFKQFAEEYNKTVESIKESQDRFSFLTGSFRFSSESLPVRFKIELTDLNNNKQVFPRTISGRIKSLKIPSLINTWVLEPVDSAYQLVTLGKSIPFGKNATILFSMRDTTGFTRMSATLLQKIAGEKEYITADSVFTTISFSYETIPLKLTGTEAVSVSGLKPSVDFSQLDAGKYAIKIHSDAAVDTFFFDVNWLDMPYSLEDLDIATRVLKYIAPESVYDNLNSGSAKSRIRYFQSFWKEKDPTPTTRYNELMHEYYRRVDYAYMNFASVKNPGWRTDRGKIFILHGAPESRNRATPPNRPPQEVWVYPQLKKSFLFVDLSGKGEYTLQTIR